MTDYKSPSFPILAILCRDALTAVLAATLCVAAQAQSSPATLEPPIVYDDLDRFAAALKAVDGGAPLAGAMAGYVAAGSPGMQIFTSRFGLSADSMVERVTQRPRFYRHLAQLRPEIDAREVEMRAALARLKANAPASATPVPIYFMVANMRAGANPGIVQTPQGPKPVIAVAIDLMAMSPRVDMSEFPKGAAGTSFDDLSTIVVHETAHIFQMQAQGFDAYRSIYTDAKRRTNLAFTIREGCADFVTWQATGWSIDGRRDYVRAHERELWTEFRPLLNSPVDEKEAWFGPRDVARPKQPMQVGYGIGMAICEAFYDAAPDKVQAMRDIYGAYLPQQFEAILAPYAARMARE
jgi:hypothetical protein